MNCALCGQPIKSPSLCKRCQNDWRSDVQSALDKRDVNTVVLHLSKLLPGMVRAAINRMFPGMPGGAFKHWHEEGISVAKGHAYEVLNNRQHKWKIKKGQPTKQEPIEIQDADHLQAYFVKRCLSLVRDMVTLASSGKPLPADHRPVDRRTSGYLEAVNRLADLAVRVAPERLQSILADIRGGMRVSKAIKREGKRRSELGVMHGYLKSQQKNRAKVMKELRDLGILAELAADEMDMRQYRLRWEPPRKVLLYEIRRECTPKKSPLSSRRDDDAA